MSDKVESWLSKKKNTARTEHADVWQSIETLHSRKLWHQLADMLVTLVGDEFAVVGYGATPASSNTSTAAGGHSEPSPKPLDPALVKSFRETLDLIEFYNQFVVYFQQRINSLRLVQLALPVANAIHQKNNDEAYEFLAKVEKSVTLSPEALVRIHTGEIQLRLSAKKKNGGCTEITAIRDRLESVQKEVDQLVGVTSVHAPFYKANALYLREVGDFAAYYRESLRYLGVADPARMTVTERHNEALLVSFAALLGEGIYNFGELLAHPILDALKGSPEAWLLDVLFAFNSGDINRFESLKKEWTDWEDLKKKHEELLGKIRILAVMEDRLIPFSEIAAKAKVQPNEVELLVMRAFARGLIRGGIDEVNRVVQVNWVQPRVLDLAQISTTSDRIGEWRANVATMEATMTKHMKDLNAAA